MSVKVYSLSCVADFSHEVTCRTAVFTDESTGDNITSWVWTFTGGNPATYNGPNPPPVIYTTPRDKKREAHYN